MSGARAILSVLALGCAFYAGIVAEAISKIADNIRSPKHLCESNLRQIGLALVQYTQDNDDKLPNVATAGIEGQSWRMAIYPYIKSRTIFLCPSRKDDKDAPDGYAISYAANDAGVYGHPAGFQGSGAFAPAGAKPLAASAISNPAHLIAVCEITGTDSYDYDITDPVRFGHGPAQVWAEHDGRANFLLADGHVRELAPLQTVAYADSSLKADENKASRNLWYREGSKLPPPTRADTRRVSSP